MFHCGKKSLVYPPQNVENFSHTTARCRRVAGALFFEAMRGAIPEHCCRRSVGMETLFLCLAYVIYGAAPKLALVYGVAILAQFQSPPTGC